MHILSMSTKEASQVSAIYDLLVEEVLFAQDAKLPSNLMDKLFNSLLCKNLRMLKFVY